MCRPTKAAQVIPAGADPALRIPGPDPIEHYVRSMISTHDQHNPGALAAMVASHLPTSSGRFRVRTETGCLICS